MAKRRTLSEWNQPAPIGYTYGGITLLGHRVETTVFLGVEQDLTIGRFRTDDGSEVEVATGYRVPTIGDVQQASFRRLEDAAREAARKRDEALALEYARMC